MYLHVCGGGAGVALGGGCCLCSGTVCLSPWCLLPHTLAFQKVTGIVYSTPSLGASQGAAGICLSSGVYECIWLHGGRPTRDMHAHTLTLVRAIMLVVTV